MAIIIVLVLLSRIGPGGTGPGDGTAEVVVVAAATLREAVVEYPIALPVVAVAAAEVPETRGDMVGVAVGLDMDR